MIKQLPSALMLFTKLASTARYTLYHSPCFINTLSTLMMIRTLVALEDYLRAATIAIAMPAAARPHLRPIFVLFESLSFHQLHDQPCAGRHQSKLVTSSKMRSHKSAKPIETVALVRNVRQIFLALVVTMSRLRWPILSFALP